jgi:hypothetical protein
VSRRLTHVWTLQDLPTIGGQRCATKAVQLKSATPWLNAFGNSCGFNYMTGAQAAQRIGVRPETLYPWLQGKSRPKDVERILAFLDSIPVERTGIMPTGCEYREYKNELL